MPDPSKFTPGYDYTSWQSSNPTKPLPGNKVDQDFANVATSIDEAVEAIKNVRRSDGALKNEIVTLDSLDPIVRAGVGAGALASAEAAAASADAASDSAVAAAASATAADGSATAASGYASTALTYRNAADGFADDSAAAATLSQTARDFAALWATAASGVDVNDGVNPVGKSAYHWAQVALGAASGALPDNSVTTSKIANLAVTRAKLATAVTDELDGKADAAATAASLAAKLAKSGDTLQSGVILDEVTFADPSSPTKKGRLDVGAVTAGQTRVLLMPDRDVDLSAVGPGWELVGGAEVNLAGQAQASWTTGLSVYERVLLIASGLPSLATGSLFCRLSRDGTTFDAGASDYFRAVLGQEAAAVGGASPSSANLINLTGSVVGSNIFSARLGVSEFNKAAASVLEGKCVSFNGTNNVMRLDFPYGYHNFSSAIAGLRFGVTAGTFTRGKAFLFGLRG